METYSVHVRTYIHYFTNCLNGYKNSVQVLISKKLEIDVENNKSRILMCWNLFYFTRYDYIYMNIIYFVSCCYHQIVRLLLGIYFTILK
jgi:hypothetical protein